MWLISHRYSIRHKSGPRKVELILNRCYLARVRGDQILRKTYFVPIWEDHKILYLLWFLFCIWNPRKRWTKNKFGFSLTKEVIPRFHVMMRWVRTHILWYCPHKFQIMPVLGGRVRYASLYNSKFLFKFILTILISRTVLQT